MSESGSSGWRRDLIGGLTTAIIAIPLCAGFGMFAFAPLGERYAAAGVLAGLYSFIVAPLIGYLLGARGGIIFGPRSMSVFVVHAMLAQVVAGGFARLPGGPQDALVLVAAVIALAAFIQLFLSALSMGELAKYIPHPVIAGFQNGAALLLLVAQIDLLLGTGSLPLAGVELQGIAMMQPLTLAIGAFTIVVAMNAHRFTRRIPALIVGLVAGTVLYYVAWMSGARAQLGAIVGTWSMAMPDTYLLGGVPELFSGPDPLGMTAFIVLWAFTLALVSSLDILLCLKIVDGFGGSRTDGNAVLRRLGAGNFLSAGLGALYTNVSLVNTLASYQVGGRTRIAGLTAIAVATIIAWQAPILVALLPRVVIAGLLVVTAFRLFDRWTLKLVRNVFSRDEGRRRSHLFDLLTIMMVVALTLTHHLVAAVALGVALSVVSFIVRMSRSIVRRTYRCDVVHSRKTRVSREADILAGRGRAIAVFELEGALFFGTADRIGRIVEESIADGVRHVVLDLRRLHDLDITAAHLLMQLNDTAADRGCRITLSGLKGNQRLNAFVRDSGMAAAYGRDNLFQDMDDAIQVCEDRLINAVLHGIDEVAELPLEGFDVVSGLSAAEIAMLRTYITRSVYAPGETIFREGDDGDEVFFIAHGSASVRLTQGGSSRSTRLVTFSPGTIFGELALLDQCPRSASVKTDSEVVCYRLHRDAFARIKLEHPGIGFQLLTNLSIELSRRLRRSNRIIYELDH